ncbi:hypothetical protein K461DRAFT_150572 [Myriangium duriaei CBS 260.36]|uniref:DUF4396 domain-containing protein n=1 Tax=Myriangium duriaei CBS 260.36 TaxID=1168546 RepID=A0A9P4IZX3_9PEZI|nr:hypothetical protein K461DRAFT_150572 [Myriangium duriaei CBS 260.36]
MASHCKENLCNASPNDCKPTTNKSSGLQIFVAIMIKDVVAQIPQILATEVGVKHWSSNTTLSYHICCIIIPKQVLFVKDEIRIVKHVAQVLPGGPASYRTDAVGEIHIVCKVSIHPNQTNTIPIIHAPQDPRCVIVALPAYVATRYTKHTTVPCWMQHRRSFHHVVSHDIPPSDERIYINGPFKCASSSLLWFCLLLIIELVAAGISTSILLETALLRYGRDQLAWTTAVQTACGMSMISMLAMEFTENTVTLGLSTGPMSLLDVQFWLITGISMTAGFVAPLPYNYFRLKYYGKACH